VTKKTAQSITLKTRLLLRSLLQSSLGFKPYGTLPSFNTIFPMQIAILPLRCKDFGKLWRFLIDSSLKGLCIWAHSFFLSAWYWTFIGTVKDVAEARWRIDRNPFSRKHWTKNPEIGVTESKKLRLKSRKKALSDVGYSPKRGLARKLTLKVSSKNHCSLLASQL